MKQRSPILILTLIAFVVCAWHEKSRDKRCRVNELVRINDTLFTYRFEISNSEYTAYLKAEKLKCDLDTFNWLNTEFRDYAGMYHVSLVYEKMPVVNVRESSANSYCRWLKLLLESKFKGKYVEVRLPTKEEWQILAGYNPELVAKFDSTLYCNFYWGTSSVYSTDGEQKANLQIPVVYRVNQTSEPLMNVNTFDPNKHGIFGVHGNAAEMISQINIAIGGAWSTNPEQAMPNKTIKFNKSSPSVGFRPIVIVRDLAH